MKKEVEVFGVTYDRYILMKLHAIMTKELGLKKVLEMPSHGAKAAGSLYSIGFAKAGCDVTLINPEQEMMHEWEDLGIGEKAIPLYGKNVYKTGLPSGEYDLAWNFVTWTGLEDPKRYIHEMKRISNKYVVFVTCNNFQPGYPWHRFLHKWYGFKWNHGEVKYNHITTVRKLFKECGLNVVEYGAIDTPGWPDPSGPRDVRLHRRYSGETLKNPNWHVTLLDYVKKDSFPGWMQLLGRWDIRFRKGVFKLPMSHLFYVIGKK
ncbi:methyltransferase domain-containing protein [Desulforegula conservatrix]|uniref:methyltransferase domain-containing protein n=1 Tax=Desulforegula conservatrix TaxID=153026 RepID=UPI00040B8537|nr:methyltransferase domain-containing protein [Desulforegula conservatrix]